MTGTTPETAGSSNSLHNLLPKRYQRKGYGLIFAILITFIHLYFGPKMLQAVWPWVLENFTVPQFFVISGLLLHTGHFLIFNVTMYIIYTQKIPFFEKYRISEKPWPWENTPDIWEKILKRSFKRLLIAHFVIIPAFIGIELVTGGPQMRFDLENFPTSFEVIKQILFFMVCEDFMFYWNHRLLHHPRIYPYIHKIHHEYSITVSLASEYTHPVEFILGNLIPANIGVKLLGMNVHYATYILWVILRLSEAVDGHCGYEFSWSPFGLLPFSGVSSYHNFHHSHNVGNYGSFFMLWDSLCGTNKAYFKHQDTKERKKLSMKQKSNAGHEDSGKIVKGSLETKSE